MTSSGFHQSTPSLGASIPQVAGDHEGAEPTELAGAAEAETESSYAWSLDGPVEDYPTQRITPRRITVAAVVVSLVVIVGAAVVAMSHLRKNDQDPQPAAAPATTTAATVTTVVAAPPPTPTPAPPQRSDTSGPVVLPARAGSVFVRTKSGKTVCQVTAGYVGCNVQSTKPMPNVGGLPASGVQVTAGGSWEWLVGDPGNPDYATLDYGTAYHALGWTISPASDGTTFVNDATGHGMTISSESFTPF